MICFKQFVYLPHISLVKINFFITIADGVNSTDRIYIYDVTDEEFGHLSNSSVFVYGRTFLVGTQSLSTTPVSCTNWGMGSHQKEIFYSLSL